MRKRNEKMYAIYAGPFPRKPHSHYCERCWDTRQQGAVGCYKKNCQRPIRVELCGSCRADLARIERESTAEVVDVCLAGSPARNGVCGDPDCVCGPAKRCGEEWPTPNDSGVYCYDEPGDSKHLSVYRAEFKGSKIILRVLQVGPKQWAAAADLSYGCGSYQGHGFGLMAPFFDSSEAAMERLTKLAKIHFAVERLGNSSCVTDAQRVHADHFTALLNSGWPLRNVQTGLAFDSDPEPNDWRERECCSECGEYNVNCTCDDEPEDFGLVADPAEVAADLGLDANEFKPTTGRDPRQLSLF